MNEQSNTIMVNGVEISLKDYKSNKAKANQKNGRKAKKRAKRITEVTLIHEQINELMAKVRVLKSLEAFYHNGYKQWGNVFNDIMEIKEIKSPYVRLNMQSRKAKELIEEINHLSKHNSKNVYDVVRRLAWQMEDVQTALRKLYEGIVASEIIYSHFQNYECINGKERRLGLKTLMIKSSDAIREISHIVKELNNIAEQY